MERERANKRKKTIRKERVIDAQEPIIIKRAILLLKPTQDKRAKRTKKTAFG